MTLKNLNDIYVLNEAILHWVNDLSNQGILITDAELNIYSWNRWLEINSGQSASKVIGRNLLEIYPELVTRRLERFYHQALSGQVVILSQRLHDYLLPMPPSTKKSNSIQMRQSVRIAPLLDNGQAIGTITVIEDVTDRVEKEAELQGQIDALKQAELGLRKHQQQQEIVVQLGDLALANIDVSTLMNEAVSLISQNLEVECCSILELLPDSQALSLRAGVGWGEKLPFKVELQSSSQASYTLRTNQPVIVEDMRTETRFLGTYLLDDRGIISGLSVSIQSQNRIFGVLLAHTTKKRTFTNDDIHFLEAIANVIATASDRLQAETQLREQAALLDVSTDAIIVCNLENQIIFWNKGAEHLYGFSASEAISQKPNQILYKPWPKIVKAHATVLEKGSWEGELNQVTKNGQEIVVESRWTLVRDEQEKPKSILFVNTDITHKKQLEAQFLRAQRMQSIGTLAGGIAHDLNNVLTPILGAAQLLSTQFVSPQGQRWLNIIEINAKRGANLIKQVLSFARGVEGEHTVLDLQYLLLEISDILKQTFPKYIVVETEISQDLWPISGDATQLHQVLMNLCVNARDVMLEGGLLKLSAKNIWIDRDYASKNIAAKVGAYVLMTIADTGNGIPPEIIERIFEPFFTTKEVGKGTGLGLSTVIGILKSHHGFINVHSHVGKGTEFDVYLPAVSTTPKTPIENNNIKPGQGELILVVDDEPFIRQITQETLEKYAYRVLTAKDGIEAIALYAQYQNDISIILVDMMMPSLDGSNTIRTLLKLNPKVKIIAVSGLASPAMINEISTLGVAKFLSKPYTANQLLQTIGEYL